MTPLIASSDTNLHCDLPKWGCPSGSARFSSLESTLSIAFPARLRCLDRGTVRTKRVDCSCMSRQIHQRATFPCVDRHAPGGHRSFRCRACDSCLLRCTQSKRVRPWRIAYAESPKEATSASGRGKDKNNSKSKNKNKSKSGSFDSAEKRSAQDDSFVVGTGREQMRTHPPRRDKLEARS